MAGLSLLTLLDDITAVLDDVAVMSKVAAKKTAGVLGDDLALNAQQVAGVKAEREIPVVWGVAKGSFRNKLILVPAALIISAIAPWLIIPVLIVGGLYLCFEGAEKVLAKYLPHGESHHEEEHLDKAPETPAEIEAFESKKIKGAIRTDFILSLEIIVIALGIVQGHPQLTQIAVVSFIAIAMTIGVYGLVAGIVKIDDLGFYLQKKGEGKGFFGTIGNGLVLLAPKLMKVLTIVGTIAMFLVGGGILEHNIEAIHHFMAGLGAPMANIPVLGVIMPTILTGILGFIAGAILAYAFALVSKLKS
ncbi:MAG: DUF808 domain-containing protein [Vibrio sp.]